MADTRHQRYLASHKDVLHKLIATKQAMVNVLAPLDNLTIQVGLFIDRYVQYITQTSFQARANAIRTVEDIVAVTQTMPEFSEVKLANVSNKMILKLHGRAKFKPFLDLNRIMTTVKIHTSAIRSLYGEVAGYHEDYEFGMDLEQRLNDPETNFGGIDKVKGIWGNVQG